MRPARSALCRAADPGRYAGYLPVFLAKRLEDGSWSAHSADKRAGIADTERFDRSKAGQGGIGPSQQKIDEMSGLGGIFLKTALLLPDWFEPQGGTAGEDQGTTFV